MGFIDNLRNALADFIEYGPNVEEGKRQKNVVHMPSEQTPSQRFGSDMHPLLTDPRGRSGFGRDMDFQYEIDKRVAEVLSGDYGNGSDRIDNLRKHKYNDRSINRIQERINSLYEKGVDLDDWAQRMRNFEDSYDYYRSDIFQDYLEDHSEDTYERDRKYFEDKYGINGEDFADKLRQTQ